MNVLPLLLLAAAVIGLIAGLIIWLVGKLGLGLEVDNLGSALLAGFVFAAVAGVITWLLGLAGLMDGGGFIGGVVHALIAAAGLLVAGRVLPGLRVKGLAGALLAAVIIGAVYWLGGQLLGQII